MKIQMNGPSGAGQARWTLPGPLEGLEPFLFLGLVLLPRRGLQPFAAWATTPAKHPTNRLNSAARLFKKTQRAPLPMELRSTLTDLILRARIGLGPQENLGCNGTTHELTLQVANRRLQVGWWNEPEGPQDDLRPLAAALERLVRPS